MHLPGCENYNVEWLSRSFSNSNNDFSLSHHIYNLHYVSRYFSSPLPNIYMYVFLPINKISKAMNKTWSNEVEDIAFIFPCLEIFIYSTIIIRLANWWYYLQSLSSISEPLLIRRPFNVMVWSHFSFFCKKNVISEPITIQAMLKSIDPKTLYQYWSIWKIFCNWINISENACEMNRSLMCNFLSNMYNKGYTSVPWT